MKRLLLIAGLLASTAALCEDSFPIFEIKPTEPTIYTFMEVLVKDRDGNPQNEKFFVGDLPSAGNTVEMVFVGTTETGAMKFQLRTKRWWWPF